MSKPVRIQRKRTKGWRMPENTVTVTRPGPYGNPYTIAGAREADYRGTDAELAQVCVNQFRADWVHAIACAKRDRTPYMPFGKPVYLGPLKGKNLACWCKLCPAHASGKSFDLHCDDCSPCHGDVLLEIANT